MNLHGDAAYQVLRTRGARFDGRLFLGVTTTGTYCRPVCRVRLPRRGNCRFFAKSARVKSQGLRPCLRRRPEQAPGLSLTDSSHMPVRRAAALLDAAAHEAQELPLPVGAARLGVAKRYLRRIFQAAKGVTPIVYLTTRRALPGGRNRGRPHAAPRARVAPWRPAPGRLDRTALPARTLRGGVDGGAQPGAGAWRLLQQTRQCLDLEADPALINPAPIDPEVATLPCAARPGVRVPGGMDDFEAAARVILGQPFTVAAARTITRRLVERLGEPLAAPFAVLQRLFPSAATLAVASTEDIGTLGIVRQRLRALQALAMAMADGTRKLQRSEPVEPTLDALSPCLASGNGARNQSRYAPWHGPMPVPPSTSVCSTPWAPATWPPSPPGPKPGRCGVPAPYCDCGSPSRTHDDCNPHALCRPGPHRHAAGPDAGSGYRRRAGRPVV
jgi:AraC family transcriptional regulator, regulatory protein of adaptative response / DNA-3-methyladenine glycosylase II